ncbi:terminase large subunit domain-containing protein [Providencia sp. PROV160]|uniref:terminase large subunit domain-containing protein n=1 Tax=Providencia sp. PROV160 TaxID=2949869 RepID=UPI002349573D|nr:terminase family protein [Providencia sp. PROV160]
MMKTDIDPRQEAKELYWQAYSVSQIAKRLGLSIHTIYSWRRRDKWDEVSPIHRVADQIHVKVLRLMAKETMTAHDFKTVDFFNRQLDRIERLELKKQMAVNTKTKAPKNHFTPEQIEKLKTLVLDSLFEYQRQWWEERTQRNRFILKSRQIGATWYFAREALLTALETGNNQIFLSASRAQAFQFKRFIQLLARQVGVELKGGDEIILSNGAILFFLGTAAATAQSYTGDLYFDEVFWVSRFLELRKVASAMATQTGLRRTYFSTPSSEDHEAYEFWTGDFYNKGKPEKERKIIELSHKILKLGHYCGDSMWRQIVNIHDAIARGLNRVNLDEIKEENPPDDFRNLYECEFVKNGERAFSYDALINCGVDGYNSDVWPDWKPYAPRPLGNRPVWVGADPTGTGDNGDGLGLVIASPPAVTGGKFRIIETIQLRGMAFEKQAEEIKRITQRYNVQSITIDGTGGTGAAVHELVVKFFPAANLLNYSAPLKRMMIMKMLMLIRNGRFEYDAGLHKPLITSFMTIKKVQAPSGIITYESSRIRGIDHGDLAWAAMNIFSNEAISSETGGAGAQVMEF